MKEEIESETVENGDKEDECMAALFSGFLGMKPSSKKEEERGWVTVKYNDEAMNFDE